MKKLCTLLFFCLLALGFSQEKSGPYLAVATKGAQIPLKTTQTHVEIAGTIAHVRTTQVYHNLGDIPIEAQYVFPLSTQAAVHRMQMSIGGRTINAKIFEREEAQKVYQTALDEGKRAAKLDQDRPNVFQMKVGNIMPGDEVTIDIYHTEMLVPIRGKYQFVAPAVVGPRFVGESTVQEESFNMPYTSKGASDTFDFGLTLNLNAGIIIQNIGSSSHDVNISYTDATTAVVSLSEKNRNPANRDFILNYSLRGGEIQSGLLLYEHGDEHFFAYRMEPMEKVKLEDIPSREYLFIVDVSGSMNGYPLEISKELMRNLLCNLRMTDTFNVQLFASSSTLFSLAPVEATTQNIEAAIRFLSEGQGGGGTQLLDALKRSYELPRKDPGSARSMVIITDGYVSVEKEAFELIKSHLDQANVFTFGIGSGVNRYLIEGMAKVSNSASFIATTKAASEDVAKDFKDYIATPLMTQVKIKAKGFDIYDVAPASIPDVFAARPITFYGKYRGKAQGKLILTGYQGKKKIKQEFKVSEGNLSTKNKALRYLWARKKIEELDDYNTLFGQGLKDSVIALGLKYNLATQYTSFVAVDETVVNEDGSMKTVKQPLSMPAHVNNLAVGAEAEVKAKMKYRAPFKILISEMMSKTEKRKLTMAFKAIYSKWISKHLEINEGLRIKFNAQGKPIQVEKKQNSRWILDQNLTKELSDYATERLKVGKEMTLTIIK